MRQTFNSVHPLVQLLILILLGFGVAFVCLMLILLPLMALGLDWMYLLNALSVTQGEYDKILMLKVVQISYAISLFAVPYFIYKAFTKDRTYTVLKSRLPWFYTGIFAASVAISFPFINAMAGWNSSLVFPEFLSGLDHWIHEKEAQAELLFGLFMQMDTVGGFAFNLVLIAMIPAVAEELFFRGMMQPIMLRTIKNQHLAIWMTAFLFSFLHMQFLGFLPRFVLGALLGYAAHWSGSLIVPMAGHFANNALALLFSWLIQRGDIDPDIETLGSDAAQWVPAVLSFLVLLGSVILIDRAAKQKTPRLEGL